MDTLTTKTRTLRAETLHKLRARIEKALKTQGYVTHENCVLTPVNLAKATFTWNSTVKVQKGTIAKDYLFPLRETLKPEFEEQFELKSLDGGKIRIDVTKE